MELRHHCYLHEVSTQHVILVPKLSYFERDFALGSIMFDFFMTKREMVVVEAITMVRDFVFFQKTLTDENYALPMKLYPPSFNVIVKLQLWVSMASSWLITLLQALSFPLQLNLPSFSLL